jgi:hypothetical protein
VAAESIDFDGMIHGFFGMAVQFRIPVLSDAGALRDRASARPGVAVFGEDFVPPRIPAAERRLGNVGVRDTGDEEPDPRGLWPGVDPSVGRTVLHQSVACG